MPQRPTHVLNLLLVPASPDRAPQPEQLDALWAELQALGIVTAQGRPGPSPLGLPAFKLLRVDRPAGPSVYGNRQGGFRVRCPSCGEALARPFSSAARRWKEGGDRSLSCPACGALHDLAALDFAPPVALGRFALELRDVAGDDLSIGESLRPTLERAFGPDPRLILSRGR